jgi:integrase
VSVFLLVFGQFDLTWRQSKTHLQPVSPRKVNRTVTPKRRPNAELRSREHLTEREVDKLIEAAKGNRWGQRTAQCYVVPFSTSGLAKLIERAGVEAKLPFECHPHMLRHATGFALANKGTDTRTLQAYLGHRSIQSAVRYTELAPGRFKNIWS